MRRYSSTTAAVGVTDRSSLQAQDAAIVLGKDMLYLRPRQLFLDRQLLQ